VKGLKKSDAGSSWWWVTGLLVCAFVLRLAPWSQVFYGGKIFLYDGDDYYHFRRIMVALANAPFLPTFDWYIGYPTGFYCPWPPLYDCMAAWIGMLAGFGGPSREFMMQLVSFIPPLGGVATLGVFYRVCRQVMSDRAALIALALASVWPMFLAYTILGRPDHHCFENFWFVTAALFVMKLFDETHRANKFFALAAGVSYGILWDYLVMLARAIS
jgi:asparagine N-glycosylation enzyme membrane subunit Stt3